MLALLGRRSGRGVLALFVCAAAWLGMAQAAPAGTLKKDGTKQIYVGSEAGIGTSVIVSWCPDARPAPNACSGAVDDPGNYYLFYDFNQGVTNDAGSGCAPYAYVAPWFACPASGISAWDFTGTSLSDYFDAFCCGAPPDPFILRGLAGNDSLNGSPGNGDTIDGGTGEDFINGVDGTGDRVYNG